MTPPVRRATTGTAMAARRRFRAEVDAARLVGGIYMASVVEAGVDDVPPWPATAFVPGPSLDDVISRFGPLPVAATSPFSIGTDALPAAADGWVTRTPHPEDRRATIVAITPAAVTALAALRDSYEGLAHDLLGDIPAADLATCRAVLTTLQARLGEVVARRMAATPPPRPGPRSDATGH